VEAERRRVAAVRGSDVIPPGLVAAQTRPPAVGGAIKDGTPTDDAVPWGFTAPEAHGAAGDGTTDDTAALLTTFAQGQPVWMPARDYRITDTVAVPAGCPAVLCWGGRVIFDRAHDRPALEVGAQTSSTDFITWLGVQVIAQSQSDWSHQDSIGIRFWNARSGLLRLARIRGFTRGILARPVSDGSNRAFAYQIGHLGAIENCQTGFELDSTGSNGWTNENIFFGGRFVNEAGVNAAQARIGIRCISSTNGYARANNKAFIGPIFELEASAAEAVAWHQQNAYNAMVGAAYRDADVLMRRDGTADGTGSHGHYHLAWTGHSPTLTTADSDRVNGAAANRGSLMGLPNLLDSAAASNLTSYGGVIA
jgi:hypothetical protein